MRFLKKAYLCVAYYFAITVFIVVSFLVNILCFLIGLIPGSKLLRCSLRAFLQFLFRIWAWFMGFTRVLKLVTPDKTPKKKTGGEIWVMNHPSILDASYMLKFITNGTCIYKQQIGSNPLYGSTAKLANYIPNVGGPDMVRMACDALARGEDLVVFPEGTRSTRVKVGNFKSGFALIAKRSKAPINVMWMTSPDDFMTRDVAFWKVPELTAHVKIDRIGRVDPQQYDSANAVLRAVVGCYRGKDGGAELRAPYPENAVVEQSENACVIRFRIEESYPYLDGHFPGNPIVPAVAQIGWGLAGVEAWSGKKISRYRLSRFKFIVPIRPEMEVRVALSRVGEKFSLQVFAEEELCCSGSVNVES